jgi:hypothetical protein
MKVNWSRNEYTKSCNRKEGRGMAHLERSLTTDRVQRSYRQGLYPLFGGLEDEHTLF